MKLEHVNVEAVRTRIADWSPAEFVVTESPQQETGYESRRMTLSKKAWRLSAMIAVAAALTVGFLATQSEKSFPDGITDVDVESARTMFLERFAIEPDNGDVMAMLGERMAVDGRPQIALSCYARVPVSHPRFGAVSRLKSGVLLVELNRARDAEEALRDYLSLSAENRTGSADDQILARKWLTYLLSVELRLEERKEIHAQTHALGLADLNDSKQFFFPHLLLYRTTRGSGRLRQFLAVDPSDRQLNVALGRYLTGEGKLAEAETLLRQVRQQSPNDLSCAAALLECLHEQANFQEFSQLLAELPGYSESEPWLLTEMRGQLAIQEERWSDAKQAFQRVLEHDPAHPGCQMGLAVALRKSGAAGDVAAAEEKSLILSRIRVDLAKIEPGNSTAILELVDACEKIGFKTAADSLRPYAGSSTSLSTQ